MTALPLPLPIPSSTAHLSVPYTDEPVALLQLDASDPIEAASAVYREVRRGRRVVAVACGGRDAAMARPWNGGGCGRSPSEWQNGRNRVDRAVPAGHQPACEKRRQHA